MAIADMAEMCGLISETHQVFTHDIPNQNSASYIKDDPQEVPGGNQPRLWLHSGHPRASVLLQVPDTRRASLEAVLGPESQCLLHGCLWTHNLF